MTHSSPINVSDQCPTLMRVAYDHRFGRGDHNQAGQRTLLVAVITVVVMAIEIIVGWMAGSMALLADGIHMGGHAIALGLAASAYFLSRHYAYDRRLSLGSGKINDLAAYTSALFLGISIVWLIFESIHRLLHPQVLYPLEALAVAIIGLIVNLFSAWVLAGSSGHDHDHPHHDHHGLFRDNNLRAALMHVMTDAVTSVAAIIGLLEAWYLGWYWIDPAIALVASVVVVRWALGLLRQTGAILLDAEGPSSMRSQVRQRLESIAGSRVADMHLWSVGQGGWTLVASVISHGSTSPETFKERLADLPGIYHSVVEIYHCGECAV